MGWVVTEYDEHKINQIFPEVEEHIMGYIIVKQTNEISSFCRCKPSIEEYDTGGRSIVHASWDLREYIERVQEIINGA
jgi:hypothetical protein